MTLARHRSCSKRRLDNYSAAAMAPLGVTMVTMASALSAMKSGSRLSCSKLRGARE
jgi:hypothetical protein